MKASTTQVTRVGRLANIQFNQGRTPHVVALKRAAARALYHQLDRYLCDTDPSIPYVALAPERGNPAKLKLKPKSKGKN